MVGFWSLRQVLETSPLKSFTFWPSVFKHAKKEQGQYPATLTKQWSILLYDQKDAKDISSMIQVYSLQDILTISLFLDSIDRKRQKIFELTQKFFLCTQIITNEKKLFEPASVKVFLREHSRQSRWLHLDHAGSQSEQRICFIHLALS